MEIWIVRSVKYVGSVRFAESVVWSWYCSRYKAWRRLGYGNQYRTWHETLWYETRGIWHLGFEVSVDCVNETYYKNVPSRCIRTYNWNPLVCIIVSLHHCNLQNALSKCTGLYYWNVQGCTIEMYQGVLLKCTGMHHWNSLECIVHTYNWNVLKCTIENYD